MAEAARILIVDDSATERAGIARVLASEGHAVTEAATGMEACGQIAKQQFDLVTLDIEMPGLSGFETLRILKSVNQDLPVVMISNVSSIERAIEAIRLGAYDYICKPVVPENLIFGVRRALAQSALVAENRRLIAELLQLNCDLDRQVQERTAELARAHADLQQENVRLEAAHARLRSLDELKTKFVTLTSHELRTPLTIITGLMDILATGHAEAFIREQVVAGVQKNLERLSGLVARITDIAHLSTASVCYRRRPVDLAELIGEVMGNLAPVFEARGLTLSKDVPASLPPVDADRDLVGQVLTDLLLNAVRFTPDGGLVSVEVLAPVDGERRLTVRVSDTGMGIAGSELQRIFDAFYESAPCDHHHSGTTEFGSGGLGLGLFIARRIIEGHGGTIEAQSGRDRGELGSTFTFTLPLAAPAE